MKTVNFATMKIFLVPIVQMFVCRTAKDKWMLLKVGNIVWGILARIIQHNFVSQAEM